MTFPDSLAVSVVMKETEDRIVPPSTALNYPAGSIIHAPCANMHFRERDEPYLEREVRNSLVFTSISLGYKLHEVVESYKSAYWTAVFRCSIALASLASRPSMDPLSPFASQHQTAGSLIVEEKHSQQRERNH
jgi:hypothetical protein